MVIGGEQGKGTPSKKVTQKKQGYLSASQN